MRRLIYVILSLIVVIAFGLPSSIKAQPGDIVRTLTSPTGQTKGVEHDGQFLWVTDAHRDGMKVYEVDPSDGSVLFSYPHDHSSPGYSGVHGLAYDLVNDLMYHLVFPHGPIYVLDATQLPSRVEVNLFGAPGQWLGDLAIDSVNQRLWVSREDSISPVQRIYELDPNTGAYIGEFIPPANAPNVVGIAWDGSYLWISEASNNTIYQVDVDQALIDGHCGNAIITQFGFTNPKRLAWDGKYLWTHSNTELYQISIDTPPVAQAEVGLNNRGYLILDGSKSYAPYGSIVAWDWSLTNQDPFGRNYTRNGEIASVRGVGVGIYDVELKVTDNDGFIGTDSTVLIVPRCGRWRWRY